MMYVLISLIVRPPQCRFPTSPAWTGSLVFHSPFSWRTCDVMRSLSGTPVTSIVYRCEVGSWQFSQRSPSAPPRTIAVRTPSLPHATMGHGGGGDRGDLLGAGRTAIKHSRALNRTGVANWPPENEPYFTLSTTKQNTSSAHQTARVCTEACQMASHQPRQTSRAIRPVVGLRAFLGSSG